MPAASFISVDVTINGKKVGGHGTFMKIDDDCTWTCRELLSKFLELKDPDVEKVAIGYWPSC